MVRLFLEDQDGDPKKSIEWELGDVKIGKNYCLKIHDEMLGYLDVMTETEQFMWCTPDHHDPIHPASASAYLIARSQPGSKIRCMRDDITGLRVMDFTLANGERFRMSDVEKNGTRIFVMEPL